VFRRLVLSTDPLVGFILATSLAVSSSFFFRVGFFLAFPFLADFFSIYFAFPSHFLLGNWASGCFLMVCVFLGRSYVLLPFLIALFFIFLPGSFPVLVLLLFRQRCRCCFSFPFGVIPSRFFRFPFPFLVLPNTFYRAPSVSTTRSHKT
jgi:hypothetical protein